MYLLLKLTINSLFGKKHSNTIIGQNKMTQVKLYAKI